MLALTRLADSAAAAASRRRLLGRSELLAGDLEARERGEQVAFDGAEAGALEAEAGDRGAERAQRGLGR